MYSPIVHEALEMEKLVLFSQIFDMFFQKAYITSQNHQKDWTCSQEFAQSRRNSDYIIGTTFVPNSRWLVGI